MFEVRIFRPKSPDLVLIVVIAVQRPGVGGHLNGVVIRVAQEWFLFLRSLPVDNAQDAPVDKSSSSKEEKK